VSEVCISCAVGRIVQGRVCTVLRLCCDGCNVVGVKRKMNEMHSGDRRGKGQKLVQVGRTA
jgi:hypothetical protein